MLISRSTINSEVQPGAIPGVIMFYNSEVTYEASDAD